MKQENSRIPPGNCFRLPCHTSGPQHVPPRGSEVSAATAPKARQVPHPPVRVLTDKPCCTRRPGAATLPRLAATQAGTRSQSPPPGGAEFDAGNSQTHRAPSSSQVAERPVSIGLDLPGYVVASVTFNLYCNFHTEVNLNFG